jgi:protein-arginine kinase
VIFVEEAYLDDDETILDKVRQTFEKSDDHKNLGLEGFAHQQTVVIVALFLAGGKLVSKEYQNACFHVA